jgi:hypothetical protein
MTPSSSAPTRLPLAPTRTPRKRVIQATRPALIDLHRKEDVWLVGKGRQGIIYLGDQRLLDLAVTPFDLPTLNRTLWQVRLGQARRDLARITRGSAAESEETVD